jgi:hypothetical protein
VRDISLAYAWFTVFAAAGAASREAVAAAARTIFRVVFMGVLLNRVIAMRNSYAVREILFK